MSGSNTLNFQFHDPAPGLYAMGTCHQERCPDTQVDLLGKTSSRVRGWGGFSQRFLGSAFWHPLWVRWRDRRWVKVSQALGQ